jgi:tetratricopeptide (TPR) repeat protein
VVLVTFSGSSAASALRGKVPTGYARLDEALQGGFFVGSAILLTAPATNEVPILLRNFLKASNEISLLICRNLSSAEIIMPPDQSNVKGLVCSEKSVPPSKNIIPGKSIDNLTELNFQISETVGSIQPRRIAIEILSDILLRHKALQTRKWLNEFLEKLRSKGITTVATLNPYMHANEEVQAVVDLFDGNLEIVENDVGDTRAKFLHVKWMHGITTAQPELPLTDVLAVASPGARSAQPSHLKEPRWLTPLIGREAELSRLRGAFEDALSSKSSVAAVQGEAGVGKTRLMQELAISVQEKGAVVLVGRAGEEKIPYGPWIDFLRGYVGQIPGEMLRRMLGDSVSEFTRLIPDIAAKIGTVPPSRRLGEEQDRLRLYEAVTQFLISISNDKPVLLLLDDMHWADQVSLGLLEHYVMGSSNSRILTLVGYRTEDVNADSPLSKTLMRLNRERLLETVAIKDLTMEETVEFIKRIFGEEAVTPEFADIILHRTGGNPFFMEEVLRSLVEDGTIFRTEKGWDRRPIQEIVLPDSVKSVLKSRLTKLGPETLNVLTMASVIGSEFEFEVLRKVTQTQEEALLERLEESITAGLISEVPNRKDTFRFCDNRIRELLLGNLIQSRRMRYQIRIAESMEKAYSKILDSQAETIAAHFSEGGDTERTIKYSILAGDRNNTIHAYDQAINDYRRALDIMDLEGKSKNEKEPVLEKLAESCLFAAQFEDATRLQQQALTILNESGDRRGFARVSLALARTYARAETGGVLQSVLTARQVLKQALTNLGEQNNSEAASIYSRLAYSHAVMDEWSEALTLAGKAMEVGEKTNNYSAVAEALATKAAYLTDSGQTDEGLQLWEQALDLALKHEQYDLICSFLSNLFAYTYPRSLAKARKFAAQHLEHHRRANDILGEAGALADLATGDFLSGDWARADDEENRAAEIMRKLGLASNSFAFHTAEGWAWLNRDNLEKAEIHFHNAINLLTEDSKITFIVSAHLGLGLVRLQQGNENEARIQLEKCVSAFTKAEYTTLPILNIETLLHLTSIYAKKNIEKARESSQWANRLAKTLKSDAGMALAAQADAALLLATGDRKGAEEAYLKCIGLWEKAGWPYDLAKALVAYSEAITRTDPEQSRKYLEQAEEIFNKLRASRDSGKPAQT